MAKTVLTFDGVDYTCPAGKTTKVVVESFTTGGLFMGVVGGHSVTTYGAGTSGGYMCGVATGLAAISSDHYTFREENFNITVTADNQYTDIQSQNQDVRRMYGTPREVFLAAGDTYDGSGIGAKYAAFEEDI